MAVIGIAILYATFYVWLGVDSTGAMKVTDCKFPSSQLPMLVDSEMLLYFITLCVIFPFLTHHIVS